MKRAIVLSAVATLGVSASVAFASGLPIGSTAVGAGSAAVSACDVNGFTYSFTTLHGDVTAVTVGDVADPTCEGGVMHLTLTDADGSSLASAGPQTVPADGDTAANSMMLPTSPQPAASQVATIHVSVSGP